jgi:PAS domain S-box-containing protein
MKMLDSLLFRLWVPLFGFLLILGVVMGVYFPEKQEHILAKHQEDQLQALANTMALGVEISLNSDNFEGLSRTLDFIAEREHLAFAAIYIDEADSTMLLASFPPQLSEEQITEATSNAYIKTKNFDSTTMNGHVVVAFSESAIAQEISSLNSPIYLILIVITMLTTALFYSNTRQIAKPLKQTALIADELRAQNYAVAISASKGPREIKTLLHTLILLRDELMVQSNANEALNRDMEMTIVSRTTELQQALSSLETSETILKSVINSALDAVVTASSKAIVLEWNHQAEVIFGYTRTEAIGKKLSDLIIPDFHVSAHEKGMENYMHTGHGPVLNKQIQIQARRKDNEIIDIELYITPIKIGSETIFSSFMRDITARLSIERELERQRVLTKSILDAIPINISLKDRQMRYVFMNAFLEERLGIQPTMWLNRTDHEIHGANISEHMIAQDYEVWTKGPMALQEEEYPINGETHHVLSGKSILQTGEHGHSIDYLLSFSFDITHQKQVEFMLKKALTAKDEFLSTMSHEIRTPLHSIIVTGEMLSERTSNPDDFQMLQTLKFSSKHLLGLINDILDFSKINSGKLELHFEKVELLRCLQGIYNQFSTHPHPNISYEKHFLIDPHIQVEIDELRLTQIITNLLSNAFKFTEKGSVRLDAEAITVNNQIRLTIAVSDTGIGIKEENLERINEAFTQENTSITRKYGGTGLGLSIVNSLLNTMNSELKISSRVAFGSKFYFTLDLQQATAANTTNQAPPAFDEIDFSKIQLLYVEDLLPNQIVMRAMVERWGVNIQIASSAKDALTLSSTKKYNLILMDIQMPEIDGTQALALLREQNDLNVNTPVVAFTANAEVNEIEHYKRLGFADVLTKPITPAKLQLFIAKFSTVSL